MKKKFVVTLLLLFVCLLSGCQMNEEIEPIRLSFIHGWGGTLRAHSIMQEIYDEFDDLPSNVVEIGNDAFEVAGGVSIEYFFDVYLHGEVEEPKTKCTQMGPWVKSLLLDDSYNSEIFYENLKIEVLEYDEVKIKKISVTVISAFDEKEI